MAVSVTLQASIVQATATWSPTITAPVGGALIVYIAVSRSTGAVTTSQLTVSGLGGTWTEIQADTYSSRRGVRSFISTNATGTGTLTISYTGTSFQALHGSVYTVTGLNLAAPIDGLDLVNSGEFGSGTSATPVVTGTGAAGDATMSFLTIENNVAVAPEAGWAELYDNGEANGIRRVGAAWDSDADTTPAWTWGTSGGYTCHAFRIKAAVGGATHEGTATVAAAATPTAAGRLTAAGTGSVDPVAGITASAALSAAVTAATPVSVGVTVAGVRAAQAAATVAAQAGVSAGAVRQVPAAAAVPVGVAIAADAVVESSESADASVAVAAGVAVAGSLVAAGAGQVPAVATVTAAGQRVAVGQPSVTVGVGVQADAVVVRSSSASISVTASAAAGGVLEATAAAAVTVAAGFSVDATTATEWEPTIDVTVTVGDTRLRPAVDVGEGVYRERVSAGDTRRGVDTGPARVGSAAVGGTREDRT